MKLVVVGSSDLHLGDIPESIVSQLGALFASIRGRRALPSVCVRGAHLGLGHATASSIEWLAWELAGRMGYSRRIFKPGLGGRSATYDRDYNLVQGATKVVAFFIEGREMEGGTGHVVHAALQKGIPVEAWAVNSSGMLTLIGSDEGYDMNEEGAAWAQQQYEKSQKKGVMIGDVTGTFNIKFDTTSLTGTVSNLKIGAATFSLASHEVKFTKQPSGSTALAKTGAAKSRSDSMRKATTV